MKTLESLKNFSIKEGEANFLIGIAGNGISTSIQTEIYKTQPKNTIYINYVNLSHTEESYILLEIVNSILEHLGGAALNHDKIKNFHTPFNIFKEAVEQIQNIQNIKSKKIVFIFDEFQHIKEYSNAFFFTFDKILSISKIINEITLTSIIITDEYLNPISERSNEGIGKLFLHNSHFDIIPAKTYDEMVFNKVKPLDKFQKEQKEKIFELGGCIPLLLTSLVDIYKKNISKEELLSNYDIEWKLQEIWDSLGKNNHEILKSILTGKNFHFENKLQEKFLKITNILDSKNNIKSELFKEFAKKQIQVEISNNDEYLQVGKNTIYLTDLSPQLEKILNLLNKKHGSLITRDEIAICMWGEKYLDKYSDYAIDKQISKLRKIISGPDGSNNVLQTKKGKGYVLNI